MHKKITNISAGKSFLFIFGFLVFSLSLAPAFSKKAHANSRYASIVMDADTGMILHQRNANKPLHPASLTKIMTLLMVFEEINAGRLSLRDRISISRHAASMVPSKLNLPAGSSIRVQDAIYALVTKSANDVAVAIAEHIGGTESNFARMMTHRAQQLGMMRTTFRNASGLHHPRQISTARDMAKLAQFVITKYPKQYEFYNTVKFTYKGKTYNNHNHLLKTYDGMDGMKTGYIRASGFNLVGSAVRNNQRLIGVVFGGRTSKSRNAHMKVLLDRGFSKLNELRIANMEPPLPPKKPAIRVAIDAFRGSAQAQNDDATKWASLKPSLEAQGYENIVGQGDRDPNDIRRVEAGLIAASALTGQNYFEKAAFKPINENSSLLKTVRATSSSKEMNTWSIQIGAFRSRSQTDKAIISSLSSLPDYLQGGQAYISPLRTRTGVVYRGRISGYNKQTAYAACGYIKDCLPISGQR